MEEYRAELLPVTVTAQFDGVTLVPDGLINDLRLKEFIKGLKEGDKVSIMYEVVNIDGTHAQNNYFHKLCRVISEDTGQAMEDQILQDGRRIHGVKSNAKMMAGLWASKTDLKSCADFSKTDFGAAIQGAIHLGETLGINLYAI